jgi:hypothetical protein
MKERITENETVEIYALIFQGGYARHVFDRNEVTEKIDSAIAAVSIGKLSKNQFIAFVCEYEKGLYSWCSRTGKHVVTFIPKNAIPPGSVSEFRLRVLLETKIEDTTDQRQRALDASVVIAETIRGVDYIARIAVLPIETPTAPSAGVSTSSDGQSVAKVEPAKPNGMQNDGVVIPGAKINVSKIITELYKCRPETIMFSEERLLTYLKALPGGENITIKVGSIRGLKVWRNHKAIRESGKTQYWGKMQNVTTEGKIAPKNRNNPDDLE